jgi:uncharacterized protein involved in type VI secretion and phage assembly
MSTVRRISKPRVDTCDERYYGVVVAIVVDVYDPDKEGRITIQFPWFDDQMITEYCRVAQLYAGNGYGAFFVPEVGDEVVVGFIHGCMHEPIILGGLYNGKDKPCSDRQKTKDQKLIRTKAGHEICFDDHDKKVTIKSKGGLMLELDDNPKKVTVKTASGQSVTLDGSSKEIKIEATSVSVSATSVSLKAGQVELCNGASEAVLLGTSFSTFFASHTHNCTAPGSPSGPPIVPMPPTMLSTKVMVG